MDKQFQESSLHPEWFTGIVEDRQDPLNLGRVRVRILGRNGIDLNLLPTNNLPWAQVLLPTNNPNPYPPKEGDQVFGMFIDGKNAQSPIILGVFPSIPQNAAVPNQGFNDVRTTEQLAKAPVKPNESATNYPRNLDEPTSSRLYRNESTDNSIVSLKESRRIPEEPSSGYAAVPPYNNVYESESGHAIEIDDTPGAERLHFYHRSGSYVEYEANGDRVERIQNDKFTVIINNDSVFVKGDATVYVDGNSNTSASQINFSDLAGSSGIQIKEGVVKIVAASKIVLEAPKVEIPEGCSLSPQIGVTGSISTPTGGVITFTDGILTNLST